MVWNNPIQEFLKLLRSGAIKMPPVDAVIGGPPCQGFSPLGRMSAGAQKREHHTALNRLWSDFVEVVDILKPNIILTENVPEFLSSAEFENYKSRMSVHYSLDIGILNAAKFGVPQHRRRAFCLGSRLGTIKLPASYGEKVTVRDAIGNLPLVPDGKNWHVGRNPTPKSVERYKVIPPGGNRFDLMRARPDITPKCWLRKKNGTTDVFGRLEWEGIALTIRTEFFKPEKGCYLHPEADRPITHREAASIQTFPEDFIFKGNKTEVARQIGEAVPPKLSEAIARTINAHLKSYGIA